jgi:hypothetical protein
MITGDLIKHYKDDSSLGVVVKIDLTDIKVLWLDIDYPIMEYYPECELVVTSSADLDYEKGVPMLKA